MTAWSRCPVCDGAAAEPFVEFPEVSWCRCPPCGRAVDDFRGRHGITHPLIQIDEASVYWRKTA